MKNLLFSELLMISHLEKKARRVEFGPGTTVIEGTNHAGKSSLVKSLYATFGADSQRIHPKWKAAQVTTAVKFSVDGHHYQILRHGTTFAVFDNTGRRIGLFSRITSELAPFLADLLDFGLRLPDKEGDIKVPTPAYLFLPFCIDQDTGWLRSWDSFAGLKQFPKWRPPTIEYHVGLRPNEYYVRKGNIERMNLEVESQERELRALKSAEKRLRSSIAPITFDIDPESFKAEIERLLQECSSLHEQEQQFKEQLQDLHNERAVLSHQIGVANMARKELQKDYDFSTHELHNEVECPTCGAVYDNSFTERFAIAKDEDRVLELSLSLQLQLKEIEQDIKKLEDRFLKNREAVRPIEEALSQKKETLALKDLIESQGRKQITTVFDSGIKEYVASIDELNASLANEKDALKKMEDRQRKEEIQSFFAAKMKSFLFSLDIHTISEERYRKITTQVEETGSALPRALLAYFWSVLHTMREYSTTPFCPVLIDSPNQQAQDKENLRKMLTFVFQNAPPNTQLIVALEDALDVQHSASTIHLSNKYSLLEAESFEMVNDMVSPLLEAALES